MRGMSWRLYAIGHLLCALLLLAESAFASEDPTATSTPCKEDALALTKAKTLGDTAFATCRHSMSMDNAAKDAEKAADADDAANPAAKRASDKTDAAANAAKADADKGKGDAKTAKDKAEKTKGKDKPVAGDDAEAKAEDAGAKDTYAVKEELRRQLRKEGAVWDAESPLRKKAKATRAAADRAKKAKDDALKAAQDAISHLKCPENKDKFSKGLKDACS